LQADNSCTLKGTVPEPEPEDPEIFVPPSEENFWQVCEHNAEMKKGYLCPADGNESC